MLLRHSVYYLFARGLPGIINFCALSVYTHILSPEDYGRYALTVATVVLINTVLFQWQLSSLTRFLPRYLGEEQRLLSTILATYLLLVLLTALVAGVIYSISEIGPWRKILPYALLLTWVQAWFELNLRLLSSRLKPMRYGALSTTRAIISLAVGSGLIWLGWTVEAPLLGLVLGGLASVLLFSLKEWSGTQILKADAQLARMLLGYGLPLSITFVLGLIISTSDRYLIAWFMDEETAGFYSAGYDLAHLSLSVLMMTVNLAAYPLVIRALENDGEGAAIKLLERQGTLLYAVAIPTSAGFMLLANNIATVVLGHEFRAAATEILPLIAFAVVLGGIKSYYFDLAFQLGQYTKGQVKVVFVASLINIILNLFFIPKYGLIGSAWASVFAYAIAMLLSAHWGKRYFRVKPVPHDASKILLATGIMAIALWPIRADTGFSALAIQIILGAFVYIVLMVLMNILDSRLFISRIFAKRNIS